MRQLIVSVIAFALTAGLASAEATPSNVKNKEKPRQLVLFDGKSLRDIFNVKKKQTPTEISYSRAFIDSQPKVADEHRTAETGNVCLRRFTSRPAERALKGSSRWRK